MEVKEFCDHLYDESTDGYIQILKLNDKNHGEKTIKIYNTKNKGLRDIVEELHNTFKTITKNVNSYEFIILA